MKICDTRLTSILKVFICTLIVSAMFITNANAIDISVVKTFRALPASDYESELYKVWVKPITSNEAFDEFNGQTVTPPVYNPNSSSNDYENSFTYKTVNDIVVDNASYKSECVQFYRGNTHDVNDEKYALESFSETNPAFPNHPDCEDKSNEVTNYSNAYNVMTNTNSWTSFDIGNDDKLNGNSSLIGAARVYIMIDMNNSGTSNMTFDIRPARYVIPLGIGDQLDEDENKFIKVRYFGDVKWGNSGPVRKVLVVDILEPTEVTSGSYNGTKWSGQFYVGFDNSAVNKSSFKYQHGDNPNDDEDFLIFDDDPIDKHPLFIFANSLPNWYYTMNSTHRADYNGCPESSVSTNEIPQPFYTPATWQLDSGTNFGKIVDMRDLANQDTSFYIEPHEINELLLKPNSATSGSPERFRICIPGGVYVLGRIIHSHLHHYGNLGNGISGSGFGGPSSNIRGVKIVGRGILSSAHLKYRNEDKYVKEDPNDINSPIASTGSGWYGHLIDIRSSSHNLFDSYTSTKDCYSRDFSNYLDRVNCVQGITLVDGSKTGIYTGGTRIDLENVKIMSWHIQTDGTGSFRKGKIKNVFTKVNDDNIKMVASDMEVKNVTSWRQRWGSVVNIGWNLTSDYGAVQGSILDGLNVIRFDPEPLTYNNGNGAIVSTRHMMGGTLKDFTFKNIVVEETPYQIINLQLNDENSYKASRRNVDQKPLDGTGTIENIEFNGVFTPVPYLVTPTPNSGPSQKSVISVFDEAPSGSPTRKINGIKFNNICIDHGSTNKLLVKWLGVNNFHTWGESIYDYFIFTNETSSYDSNSIPDYLEALDVGSIDPGYQIGTNNAVSPYCEDLKNNNCTYEKFRTANPSCL